jgi:hypothetical protein
MGTQQILLIVLSVIIVGAAIAVGIQMFNNQAYSANKSAIAADAQSFASQVVQYYKTPESQGGLGGDMYVGGDNTTGSVVAAAQVGGFIGWGGATTSNDSGDYTITVTTGTHPAGTITITGVGKEEKDSKNPQIITVVALPAGTITATASDVTAD